MSKDPFFETEMNTSSGGSLFFRPEKGESKVRILTTAKVGWEGWYNNKPVRFPHDYNITADEYATLDKQEFNADRAKWKQFAVCLVWNYAEEKVQIWQFHQKAIINELMNLANDPDWGDVTKYDIKIKREGEALETKYYITPTSAKELTKEVKEAVEKSDVKADFVFEDSKNKDNVNTFKDAVKASGGSDSKSDKELNPDDIPF